MGEREGIKDRLIAAAIFLTALVLRVVYLYESRVDPLRDVAGRGWKRWELVDSAYYHQLGVQFSEGQLTTSLAYYLAPLYSYTMGWLPPSSSKS